MCGIFKPPVNGMHLHYYFESKRNLLSITWLPKCNFFEVWSFIWCSHYLWNQLFKQTTLDTRFKYITQRHHNPYNVDNNISVLMQYHPPNILNTIELHELYFAYTIVMVLNFSILWVGPFLQVSYTVQHHTCITRSKSRHNKGSKYILYG